MTAMNFTPDQMIAKLVGFDTVSYRSNLPLIDFVEDYLRAHGVAAHRVYSPEGDKANLYATIGPQREGGVVLSGHSDVVPVAHQTWASNPFTVVEREGRLYGRGTADMKGFVAICLALVLEFKAADLQVPIHLAISYDEEIGCFGCTGMVEAMAEGAIAKPRAVIVGEPTSMQLVVAHKGINVFHTTVTGREAHSSQPHRGASAITGAAKLIGKIEEMAGAARGRAPADSPFEPPYTTFSVGQIEGGHAPNIIPGQCSFVWEFRPLPGEDAAAIRAELADFSEREVLPGLRASAPEADVYIEEGCAVIPLAPEEGEAAQAEALVRELTGQNTRGAVSYGTEGGVFQRYGFSTVVIGPGSIDQAHQPDEFIAREQVEECVAFLRGLKDWACRQ